MAGKRPRKLDKTNIKGLRVGLYCRVSKARGGAIEKSTEDQGGIGRQWAIRYGVKIAAIYMEAKSASRFGRTTRDEFEKMCADVAAGRLDIIWFWAIDRSNRNLGVFIALRDLCRDYGVLIAENERIYDPSEYADMLGPIIQSLVGEGEAEQKSLNSIRGLESNAKAGLPSPPIIYGYKRLYRADVAPDRQLRDKLIAQIPNGMLDESLDFDASSPDADDLLAIDSPAAIVRKMFRRYAAGDSDGTIAYDLNRHCIPVARKPGHGRASANPVWRDTTIAKMLANCTYAAIPFYQGQMMPDVEATWPALVDRELYWAVQERRAANKPYRTGRGPYLLASTVRCGKCNGTLLRWKHHKTQTGHYTCATRGCYGVSIEQEPLDLYVEDKVVLFLSDPKVYAAMAEVGGSEEAAAARAEAAEARAKLQEVYDLFANEKISDALATARETRLLEVIAEAEKRANDAGIPSVLGDGVIGPQAPAQWTKKTVLQKREIIRKVAEITIKPIGKGRNNQYTLNPIGDRVAWKWLIGPDAAEPSAKGRVQSRFEVIKPDRVPGTMTETDDGRIILAGDYTTAEKGDLARRLMAERGWSGAEVARRIGLSHTTVTYWLTKASGPPLRVPQRQRTKSFLLETELNHSAAARVLGVAPVTVDRACHSLIADGTTTGCAHRLTVDGKLAPGRRTATARV